MDKYIKLDDKFKVVEVNEFERLFSILNDFNFIFKPELTERILSLEVYSQKILSNGYAYAVVDGENTVGFITFYINDEEIFIALIAVEEKYRGNNIGSKLLEYIEEICRTNRISNIRLEVDDDNSTALSFYFKNGFKKLKRSTEYSTFLIKNVEGCYGDKNIYI